MGEAAPSTLGPGIFVAVTGPSGSGKDRLIAYALERLGDASRFTFVRRVITRQPDGVTEHHDTLDDAAFLAAAIAGRFALSWAAHGNRYGLPISIDGDISAGRVVIANVSRKAVVEIESRYERTVLVRVSAHPDVIARRLAARAREDAAGIALRLLRSQLDDPGRPDAIELENSGPVELAGDRLVAILRSAADSVTESPSQN